jgi:hypothetical protein
MLSQRNIRDIDAHLESLVLIFDNAGEDRGRDIGIFMHALVLDLGPREGRKALDYVHRKWRHARTELGANKI